MTAKETIRELLEKHFKGTEFFLVDVKQSGAKYQVFIDSDTTLKIAKCAETSRFLEAYLEENNLVPEAYTLEVSSPGMLSPLKHLRQYTKRIGKEIELWTEDNTHYRGTLTEIKDQSAITLNIPIKEKKKIVSSKDVSIAIDNIRKATLIFSFKSKK